MARPGWYLMVALLIALLECGVIAVLLLRRSARRRGEDSLRDQVRFLHLALELSSSRPRQSAATVDEWLTGWLGRLGQLLAVDRAEMLALRHGVLQVMHWWPGGSAPTPPARADEFPWGMRLLRAGEVVPVGRMADLPREAATDRASWERNRVKSILAIPLIEQQRTIGVLTLTTCGREREWAPDLIAHLRLVGDVFAAALATRQVQAARAAGDQLSETLLGLQSGPAAVLDRDGTVVSANQAWIRLERQPGRWRIPWSPVGGNYLEACRTSAGLGGPVHAEAVAGIASVLAGSRQEYRLKYQWPARHPEELIVVPLGDREAVSIVSYIDSTDLERAEREAQELRHTIAHFDRVVAIGDLSASLAHELNQPLTAILSNVQAARRFLAAGPHNLEEVHEILSDIEEDDRRAGEVIRRLRALLRKETADWQALCLGDVVHEVAGLVSTDARARHIVVRLDLDETLPPVHGDRVQLCQVVLNLVMNGADAMHHTPPDDRELLIRTWRYDDRSIGLSVRDRGSGIQVAPIERVFEPFYTSKAEGLGMGLSICQTILHAHGGRIWAANNPDRGATFHLVLPTDRGEGR